MAVTQRKDRVPFRFSGPDAQKLLNDVLTGTFEADAAKAHWWALLSPQGKIQAEGLAAWAEDGFWLDANADVAESFFKRMRLYKLRANLAIQDMSATHAVGWSAGGPEPGISHLDPRGKALGWRIIAPREMAKDWTDSDLGWHATRIAEGVTELGSDYEADSRFPHDVGMDLLGGVDFAKGCYVGQEVVSRMQHRGTARRRPVIVSGAGLQHGGALELNGREIGALGHVAGDRSIAIVRIDRIDDPAAVTSNGVAVNLALPEWASYRFGETSSNDSETD